MEKIKDVRPFLEDFKIYHEREPGWGGLHIVLDDGNFEDDNVDFCLDLSIQMEEFEVYYLARLLQKMSKTQRKKIQELC